VHGNKLAEFGIPYFFEEYVDVEVENKILEE